MQVVVGDGPRVHCGREPPLGELRGASRAMEPRAPDCPEATPPEFEHCWCTGHGSSGGQNLGSICQLQPQPAGRAGWSHEHGEPWAPLQHPSLGSVYLLRQHMPWELKLVLLLLRSSVPQSCAPFQRVWQAWSGEEGSWTQMTRHKARSQTP